MTGFELALRYGLDFKLMDGEDNMVRLFLQRAVVI